MRPNLDRSRRLIYHLMLIQVISVILLSLAVGYLYLRLT